MAAARGTTTFPGTGSSGIRTCGLFRETECWDMGAEAVGLTPIQRLKVELLTEGLDVTPEATAQLAGSDGRDPLTLADYATTSGIALELEGGIWVNAPIRQYNPNFVETPRHQLTYSDHRFQVVSDRLVVSAQPIPVPAYHSEVDSFGWPYPSVGVTHTDRIRVSPIEGCAFRCQFCDLSHRFEYRKKSAEELIETVAKAIADPILPARHAMISGGSPREQDHEYLNDVFRRVCAAFPDIAVDVMMAPIPGLLEPEELLDAGVNGLSINLELHSEDYARRLMPQKGAIPRTRWLGYIDEAVRVFGRGRVRSLLLVGLEPLEETLEGVAALARLGCEPVLSPFRPDPATPLRSHDPPTVAELIGVYERAVDVAAQYDVKLGPRCIPCHHNTLTFPDGSDYYFSY